MFWIAGVDNTEPFHVENGGQGGEDLDIAAIAR
jgi:hypothetical protein